MTIRVLVADDQSPFRGAARAVLAATPEFELVGEANSGEEAVALVGALRPDVVLMDIKMDGLGGIEATRSIAGAYPETMTILLSTYREEDLPPQAHECGAAAYLHKSNLDGDALRRLWARRQPSSPR
jgi:two-component system invasion response regulator UvrY